MSQALNDDDAAAAAAAAAAAGGNSRHSIDDAAARAWGSIAAAAHAAGDTFCRQLSPYHAALRMHTATPASISWLTCPASWATLTFMMGAWARDSPHSPSRSLMCHAAWSPLFDVLLPPSAAVFDAAAAAAGGTASYSAAYQLAAAMRQRHVFVTAYTLHRSSPPPLIPRVKL